jgi:hypothetical protein
MMDNIRYKRRWQRESQCSGEMNWIEWEVGSGKRIERQDTSTPFNPIIVNENE